MSTQLLVPPQASHYCTYTYPSVDHASSRYESKEGFGLFDQRLPDTFNQALQPSEPYFYAAGHVESMEAGTVMS